MQGELAVVMVVVLGAVVVDVEQAYGVPEVRSQRVGKCIVSGSDAGVFAASRRSRTLIVASMIAAILRGGSSNPPPADPA